MEDEADPHCMNGIQLATQARSAYPGVKIILASGYPLSALRAEPEFPFVNKPYRLADLAELLRAVA